VIGRGTPITPVEATVTSEVSIDKILGIVNAKLIGLIPDDDVVSKTLLAKRPVALCDKRILVFRFLDIARGITGVANIFGKLKPPPPPPFPSPGISIPSTPELKLPKPLQTSSNINSENKSEIHDQYIVDEDSYTEENEIILDDIMSSFLGTYGDPSEWVQSTLKNVDSEDLVEIHVITQSMFVSGEAVRKRMWLHDLLDDIGIPYYIEVGGMSGGKALQEAQIIYVEKKNYEKARILMMAYNQDDNIIRYNPANDDETFISEDGIPQKRCPSCKDYIDFDHVKCPSCYWRLV